MLRCLLLTLAVVSATSAVKCYSGCVAGTIEMAGQSQGYPGGECTDDTTAMCEAGCLTVSLMFDYEMEVGETKMEGSADATTAMCSMGNANDNLCDTMKSSMESTMGAVSNLKCDVSAPCETEKCNDPAKSGGKGESDGGEGEGEGEGESSSFAVHGVSFVLLSAVLGLLY